MSGRIPSIVGPLGGTVAANIAGLCLATLAGLCLVTVTGCSLNNPGNDPPAAELNFPLATQMSPVPDPSTPPGFLYVANSDFDLRFNAGSVASYDLGVLAEEIEQARVAGELPTNSSEPPIVVSAERVLGSQVKIGSYTSAMVLSEAGDRLYLSVRSDANLTYIDVNGGALSCGNGDSSGFSWCADSFRSGDEATANPRRLEIPKNPTGLAVGRVSALGLADDGDYVVMSHAGGQASLFIDRSAPATGGGRPTAPLLVDVLDDLGGPIGQISTRIDESGIAWMPTTDARSDRADNFLSRVGVAADLNRPELSYLYNAGTARLEGISTGEDTRDIAFATGEDGTNYAFILSRTPEALILVDMDQSTPSRLFVRDLVSVGYGPSRLKKVYLPVGPAGVRRLFIFITCFDSRDVFVVDPLSSQTFTISRTISGPFELEVDEARGYMYVTDFRASVIWVVDLAPLIECLNGTRVGTSCEPFRIASIGTPQPVRDLL
ncbi:MAG: hypothetical protein DRJ42_31080 [Deltaproteobacteria bacterium]|nr:MAG: hypothetical protein DRJ42_31080 [Deltaproteobacteria bacterium]